MAHAGAAYHVRTKDARAPFRIPPPDPYGFAGLDTVGQERRLVIHATLDGDQERGIVSGGVELQDKAPLFPVNAHHGAQKDLLPTSNT